MTDVQIDPRPLYARALSWVNTVVAGVRPDQLDDPTPCSEFDVRALLGHLVATVDRARVIGEGGDVHAQPQTVTGVPDDGWGTAYGAAVAELWTVWGDDALLDRPVAAPWGTVPGRASVWGYLNETLVHGWDVAVATGQDPEADPDLAGTVQPIIERVLPAAQRGGPVPFGPVVEPAPGVGPTERLANWAGHHR